MGLIDNIKNLFGRKSDDRVDSSIERFNSTLKDVEKEYKLTNDPALKEMILKAKEMQNIINEKYKEIKKINDNELFKLKANVIADMAMYAKTYLDDSDKNRWLYTFDDRLRKVEFKRPANEQDMTYRQNVLDSIIPQLQNIIPESDKKLFHSTSIDCAKAIIQSKSLSSSADRYDGYDASTDGYGRISVAGISKLDWSTSYWLDARDPLMPCGALFVLKEGYEGDFDPTQHQMDSIDFSKNPEQLLFVISSPENINVLKQTMQEAGLDLSIVYTFDEYLELEQEKHKEKPKRIVKEQEEIDSNKPSIDEIIEAAELETELEATKNPNLINQIDRETTELI